MLLPGEPSLVDADAEIRLARLQPRHDPRKNGVFDTRRVRVEEREEQGRRGVPARAECQLTGMLRPAVG